MGDIGGPRHQTRTHGHKRGGEVRQLPDWAIGDKTHRFTRFGPAVGKNRRDYFNARLEDSQRLRSYEYLKFDGLGNGAADVIGPTKDLLQMPLAKDL